MPNPISPFTPPPAGARNNPETAAKWIASNVPCFDGPVPLQWTDAVYREATRWGISLPTTVDALVIARKYGHRFAVVRGAESLNRPAQPEIRAISTAEVARNIKYTLEVLDSKYTLAEATNNVSGMEAAFAAALKIVWEAAKFYAKVKEAQLPEKMVEWEEFNRSIDATMERAQSLRTHFRRLTRDELARLREAPTPQALSGVTFRIVNRVVPRPVRSTRK